MKSRGQLISADNAIEAFKMKKINKTNNNGKKKTSRKEQKTCRKSI